MSEVNMEKAQSVYETVCATLDSMELNYDRHDDDLVVTFGHRGDDMNHDLIVAINAKQECIQVMERLPFKANPEKAADIAMALCYVNSQLLSGGFTYDMNENVRFEVNHIYTDSIIGEETVKRLILALVFSVEEYDDKIMALGKGYLTPEDFK